MLGAFALRPFLRRGVEPQSCNQCDLCGVGCHGAATSAVVVRLRRPAEGTAAEWMAAECFGLLQLQSPVPKGSLRFHSLAVAERNDGSAPAARYRVIAGRRSRRGFARRFGRRGRDAGQCRRDGPAPRHAAVPRPDGNEGIDPSRRARCRAGVPRPLYRLRPVHEDLPDRLPATGRHRGRVGRAVDAAGRAAPGPLRIRLHALRPRLSDRRDWSVTVEEKHQVKIGIAVLDHSRCIPYAYGRDCGTCVEACPFPDKAIRLVDVEVSVHDGKRQRTIVVSQPMVDPDRCTGCGGCVKECTFKDEPAIRVVSANESRHPGIKPFLDLQQVRAKKDADAAPAAPEASPYGTARSSLTIRSPQPAQG